MNALCRFLVCSLLVLLALPYAFGQDVKSVTASPNPVTGGAAFTGTVTLTKAAGSSGLKIELKSSSTSVATVPSSVTVASGQTSATFTGHGALVTADETATLTAADPSDKSVTTSITVDPPTVRLTGVSLSPTTVVASDKATGTITVSSAAPSAGFVVKLSSSGAYATVPTSVKVASGAKSATFSVSTTAVASNSTATLTAEDSNGYLSTAKLEVTVPSVHVSSLTVSPNPVTAANPATGTVTLTADAPTGGFKVNLSTLQTYIGVPSSVTVSAGKTSATFTVISHPVSAAGTATISAVDEYGYDSEADLKVQIPSVRLTSLTISPSSVNAGSGAVGTVGLSANAPTGGTVVYLSTMQSYVGIPKSVTVAAGKKTATFALTTSSSVSSASKATVTAQDANDYVATASLTVNPAPTTITMTSTFKFSPQTVTVPAGSTIIFSNVSSMYHDAASDIASQTINSGALAPKGIYTWTVPANAASGTTFYYHCNYHGTAGNGSSFGTGMVGVVVVK